MNQDHLTSHKKGATLKDIAEALQISVSTVSRALKEHPRISLNTQRKVKQTANRLGYLSIDLLEEKKKKHSNLIGVIVPKISYHLYAMAISGIEKVAEANGMHIIVCQSNESYEREKSLVEELSSIGVNGILVSLASETKEFLHFKKAKQLGIPIVFFNRECNNIAAHKVSIDNKKAAFDATQHLIDIGCRNITYFGGTKTLQINRDRIDGYLRSLAVNNITSKKEDLIYSSFDKSKILSAARKLLYAPIFPNGILAFSDQIAIQVMIVAKERGIKIPEQLAIIGFNNEPVNDLIEPSLTSIDQPAFTMGEEAAKLLIAEFKKPSIIFEKKTLNSFLMIRNSTNRNKKQPNI